MKALALAVVVQLAAGSPSQLPYGQAPTYAHQLHNYHHPQVYHQTPTYSHAAPYGYHQPQPHYGYEHPKHNCTIQEVVELAEVCTPAFETKCESVELKVKTVEDKKQCFPVTRTVCSETVEEIENEICTYSYQPKSETTKAKTLDINFNKECSVQMVTVCQPAQYGYGYGHNYCKEVAQETCYNIPSVVVLEPEVEVKYPEPVKTCVNKPLSLPKISCEDLSEEKCITVPQVVDKVETSEKCITQLGAPHCQAVELTLPKQVCVEIVYGYAQDTHKHEEQLYPAQPTAYPTHPPAYHTNTYASAYQTHQPPSYQTNPPPAYQTHPPPSYPTHPPPYPSQSSQEEETDDEETTQQAAAADV